MSRPSPPSLHTSENEVERRIIGFLQDQTPPWIIDRNHVGLFFNRMGTPVKIGRPGQCDWRAMRAGQYFEFEVKAPGEKPKPAQYEYMATRTHQGILVTWADSLEMFQQWYPAVMTPAEKRIAAAQLLGERLPVEEPTVTQMEGLR